MKQEPIIFDFTQKELLEEKRYAISEIFSSIQGEGALIGMPVTFIRLQGCNLTCPFCDSKKTWAKLEPNMSVMDILQKVDQNVVVITGGEPCMQDLKVLIDALHYNQIFVSMETNGTLPIPEGVDWVTCSPKLASGDILSPYHIDESNFDKIGEYKFVVTPEFKYEDIPEPIRGLPTGAIWLQPESSDMQGNWKRCYDLALEHNLRVGVQLHVLMGVE